MWAKFLFIGDIFGLGFENPRGAVSCDNGRIVNSIYSDSISVINSAGLCSENKQIDVIDINWGKRVTCTHN